MKIVHRLIATAFGLGYSPIAPGTAGALGGLLVAFLIQKLAFYPGLLLILSTIFFLLAGIYSSTILEKDWGKDPSKIVIDEVVGMWISLWFLPSGWWQMVLAFVFFRLFDIYKPFYIRKMESLKGGWGIMMDDVLAGIYANLSVRLIGVFVVLLFGS